MYICTLVSEQGSRLLGEVCFEHEAVGIIIQGIEKYIADMAFDDTVSESDKAISIRSVGAWCGEYDKGFAYEAIYLSPDYHTIKCTGYAFHKREVL